MKNTIQCNEIEVNMTIESALERAVGFHKNCELAQAEDIYRKIISVQPDNVVAGFLLSQLDGVSSLLDNKYTSANILFDSFRRFQCHYSAVLPYNLNWMLSDVSPVHDFLSFNPIVVADIGARGSHLGELAALKEYLVYYGFDADREECRNLMANQSIGFSDYRVFPYYVGKENGLTEFNIYRDAGESSRLKPGKRFQRLFNQNLVVERVERVESATLDTIIKKEGLAFPEFIKLDTQGTELEILQSSPCAVSQTLLIEVEVEFTEMYDGQPLFHDVARFMNERGFDLLYLNRVFQTRPQYDGEARGQLTFGDALFGRRDHELGGFEPNRVAKYAILLANYGHLDIAEEIWRTNEGVRSIVPDLCKYFVPYQSASCRINSMTQDKLLCWQLYRRRTNQIGFDTDRSWPFR